MQVEGVCLERVCEIWVSVRESEIDDFGRGSTHRFDDITQNTPLRANFLDVVTFLTANARLSIK